MQFFRRRSARGRPSGDEALAESEPLAAQDSPGKAGAIDEALTPLVVAALREAPGAQPPSAVDGDAAEALVAALHGLDPASAAPEVLAMLKPAIKASSPAQALRGLTLLDTVARSLGPHAFAELGNRKWTQRVVKIATGAADGRVRLAAQQLIADWAVACPANGTGNRAPFESALTGLGRSHAVMPPHGSVGGGTAGGAFVRGRAFGWEAPPAAQPQQHTQPPQPPPPLMQQPPAYVAQPASANLAASPVMAAYPGAYPVPPAAMPQQPPSQEPPSELIARMRGDLEELGRACRYMKEERANLEAVQKVAEQSAGAFERCLRWQEEVAPLLEQPLAERDLMSVLEMNDMLNALIPRWQALLSSSTGEHSDETIVLESSGLESRRLTADDLLDGDFGALGGFGGREASSYESELDGLRRELRRVESEAASSLAAAAAAHAEEVANVKGLAVNKLKELQAENEMLRKEAAAGGGAISAPGSPAAAAQQATNSDAALEATHAQLEAERKERKALELRVAELEGDVAQGTATLNAARGETEALRVKLAALEAEAAGVVALRERAEAAEATAKKIDLELRKESVLRKKAYNQIRELRGNIRVVARVRPAGAGSSAQAARAKGAGDEDDVRALHVTDSYTCQLAQESQSVAGTSPDLRRYEFDACLGEESTQDDVYAEVGDVVQSALDGYKVCVFAYGQTGSGKTFTMVGTDGQPGLLPRCAKQLFTGGDTAGRVTVRVHVLELYQDTLVDLLCASPGSGKGPNVRRDAATGDVSVEGAEAVTASDADTLLGVCRDAFKRRATASTKMNSESSRSHLLLMFQTEHVAHNTGTRSRGKLTLVDLAGSERVKKSGAEGKLLDEAKAINASLSALGDVVSALTKNEKHIPYRNHRLTQLMSDSLGGQAKTLMIVNVSPLGEDGGETKNSLDYASRVKLVTNEASRSVETKAVLALKREVEELRKKLKG